MIVLLFHLYFLYRFVKISNDSNSVGEFESFIEKMITEYNTGHKMFSNLWAKYLVLFLVNYWINSNNVFQISWWWNFSLHYVYHSLLLLMFIILIVNLIKIQTIWFNEQISIMTFNCAKNNVFWCTTELSLCCEWSIESLI